LCGEDPVSGRNFDHRRNWVEQRLVELAQSFAVGLYAWAVMGNHTHVVLRIDPTQPTKWSDEEVAWRWARLARTLVPESNDNVQLRVKCLLEQPARLEELRNRLGSLSWFMRFLNECIARQANAEDSCTGRFWEGRFRCQALLDEASVLACMAYVDLNPIRAGLAEDLSRSDFTTIQRRLRGLAGENTLDTPLGAVAGEIGSPSLTISVRGYVDLVDWSGRLTRPDTPAAIDPRSSNALAHIRGSPNWWSRCIANIEGTFGTAVGLPESLRARAAATGRRSLRGI
jgi:REP element-mobilizing transposase RayT